MAAESESNHCAAIASVGAARVYGLTVLAENIQQNMDNQTRFYVLTAGTADETAAGERIVFSAEGQAKDLPYRLFRVSGTLCPFTDVKTMFGFSFDNCAILANFVSIILLSLRIDDVSSLILFRRPEP